MVGERLAVCRTVRRFLDDEREALRQQFITEPTGQLLCHRQADLFDVVLIALYDAALKVVEERLGPFPTEADLCVAATGGYGRAALAPWSDIDVVFIPSHEANENIDALVREIMLLLGDVLVPGRHPQVAHSYRPLNDIGLIDHQTATALLESRFVAGNGSLHSHFMSQLMRAMEPVEFVHLNYEERTSVWHDPHQSVYAVEPNLKSGRGGLRDFHAAIWVAKVVYGIQDWDTLRVLRERGVVSWEECAAVLEALEFLHTCRNWLHYERGAKFDQLSSQHQAALGRALGYPADDPLDTPAERVMRDYYRHARRVHQFSRRLFAACKTQRLEFRNGTHVVNWALYPNHAGIFQEDPVRLVSVFEDRQRLGLEHSLELERLIAVNAGLLDRRVINRLAVGSTFLRILGSPGDVAGTLRAMLRCGVLEQLLPEFAPLMTFLPGDPAHEYTVGEHSLKVIEDIQRLRDNPDGDEEAPFSEAIRALQEPEVLFLAALFHDVGKLDRTGEHSETGAPVGAAVARRLGMQDTACEKVRFLIREHLTMMRTARLRALPLFETIENFVQILPATETLDALDMLAVLTCADARSVGQNIFRENERRLLLELFVKAAKWLQEQPITDEPGVRERISRRLKDAPALRDYAPEVIQRHLAGMPTWYAVNTPPALMAKHIEYFQRVAAGEDPVVEFYHALQAMHTEVTVCTTDRPGILRDIAAAVTANNLDIYLAQSDVCSAGEDCPAPRVMSTIWVDDFGQPLGQSKRDRLRIDLESLLRGDEAADEVLRRRGKVAPERVVVHNIRINNTDSRAHSVITIRADDQKGLLYRLAQGLHDEGLDLAVAKITTWRGAAEDAFYVTKQTTGEKIDDDEIDDVINRLQARLTGEGLVA